ncbi:MAG: tyrosine-type recombinase/integrase [Bacillota bacterium]
MTLSLVKTDDNDLYIREYLLYMQSDKGCRPRSLIVYRQDLEEFKNYFTTKDLLELKERDIREYKHTLVDRKLAPRTINRKLAVIRSFYNYFLNSEEWQQITRNPSRNITAMKVKKTAPIILNETQAETLLDGILLTGLHAIRDYAMFLTFLTTGVRVSELINLEVGDIDFDNHLLHVRDGKGGKDRSIPMIPRLESALKIYLLNGTIYKSKKRKGKGKVVKTVNKIDRSKCGRDYFINPGNPTNALFLTQNGTRFSERGVDYLFKRYTKMFNLYRKKLSLHALRRSCLTFLYKQGVDIFILKEISGHVRVQTLEHYLHIDKSKVLKAMHKHPLAKQGMDLKLVDLVRSARG